MMNPITGQPVVDKSSLRKQETVINVFGNVNKLFQIKDYSIGAVISGLGIIGESTFDEIFDEFESTIPSFKKPGKGKRAFSVSEMANKIARFIETRYRAVFPAEKGEKPEGPGLLILLGGYSRGERKGEIYGISLPAGEVKRKNDPSNPYGLSVSGQHDAIVRFLSGSSPEAVPMITSQVFDQLPELLELVQKEYSQLILQYLEKKGFEIPEDVKAKIPKLRFKEIGAKLRAPTPKMTYKIEFRHMSLQDAVDFAMFLTTLTYGRQRFVSGIPTVGGKVNLATITRKDGFRLCTPQAIRVTEVNI
jgi:hypothetical protein